MGRGENKASAAAHLRSKSGEAKRRALVLSQIQRLREDGFDPSVLGDYFDLSKTEERELLVSLAIIEIERYCDSREANLHPKKRADFAKAMVRSLRPFFDAGAPTSVDMSREAKKAENTAGAIDWVGHNYRLSTTSGLTKTIKELKKAPGIRLRKLSKFLSYGDLTGLFLLASEEQELLRQSGSGDPYDFLFSEAIKRALEGDPYPGLSVASEVFESKKDRISKRALDDGTVMIVHRRGDQVLREEEIDSSEADAYDQASEILGQMRAIANQREEELREEQVALFEFGVQAYAESNNKAETKEEAKEKASAELRTLINYSSKDKLAAEALISLLDEEDK